MISAAVWLLTWVTHLASGLLVFWLQATGMGIRQVSFSNNRKQILSLILRQSSTLYPKINQPSEQNAFISWIWHSLSLPSWNSIFWRKLFSFNSLHPTCAQNSLVSPHTPVGDLIHCRSFSHNLNADHTHIHGCRIAGDALLSYKTYLLDIYYMLPPKT